MKELLILIMLHTRLARLWNKPMETINEPTTDILRTTSERRRRRRPRPQHTPRISHPSAIVNPASITPLHGYLPARYQAHDWQAVYSTMRDGISLQTFFARCKGSDPVIVLIRDSAGAVFGYYSSVGWKASPHYYGNGEAFVFTLEPHLKVYKWSRMNSYHQLASSESIAVGGGGKFAIFVDSMLERGSSGHCQTYDSPCLASHEEFEVVVMEAYKLVPSYKLQIGQDES